MRIEKISKVLGLVASSYEHEEAFYLTVAQEAELEGWEVDRILYHYQAEVLAALGASSAVPVAAPVPVVAPPRPIFTPAPTCQRGSQDTGDPVDTKQAPLFRRRINGAMAQMRRLGSSQYVVLQGSQVCKSTGKSLNPTVTTLREQLRAEHKLMMGPDTAY